MIVAIDFSKFVSTFLQFFLVKKINSIRNNS